MKTKQLEDTIRELFVRDMEIMVAKNHDYSSEEDALENFRDWGLTGFAVRIGDKYKRLKNIIQKGGNAVQGEGLEDALLDIGVYCYLARVFLMEKKMPEYPDPTQIKVNGKWLKDTSKMTATELIEATKEEK